MNHYAVLGVAEDASSEAIHNAYRTLARQYHPDAGAGSSALKFREIVEAYETLGDPERRSAYDRMLAGERRPTPKYNVPNHEVVVEPLAQPWFSSRANSAIFPFAQPAAVDDWFEEVFRSFEEFLSFRRW
jgi:curved DNA-binding protein CbpA